MPKKKVACGCAWGLMLAICCGIYWGILFGLWVPYMTVDWNSSECIVQRITNHKFVLGKTDNDNNQVETTEYYARFDVLVNVSNTWMHGFSCGTPSAHGTLESTGPNGLTPTMYGKCPAPSVCGMELFLPMWFCRDCKVCDQFLTGEPTECQYTVLRSGDTNRPRQYASEYPVENTEFIAAVLADEVYSSIPEFIVLNVIVGGGILIVVVALCFGFGFGLVK